MAARYQKKLLEAYGGICHYCKEKCNTNVKNKYPTRDHVVPRAFGGHNGMDNYVLACQSCNNKRGTMLFYCRCRSCMEKILDALYDPKFLSKAFDGIISHNRPVVKRGDDSSCPWIVRVGHSVKKFPTFQEAFHFASTVGCIVEDKDYK